jgi:hypothetical protein
MPRPRVQIAFIVIAGLIAARLLGNRALGGGLDLPGVAAMRGYGFLIESPRR